MKTPDDGAKANEVSEVFPPRFLVLKTLSGYRVIDGPHPEDIEYLSLQEHQALLREARASAFEEALKIISVSASLEDIDKALTSRIINEHVMGFVEANIRKQARTPDLSQGKSEEL